MIYTIRTNILLQGYNQGPSNIANIPHRNHISQNTIVEQEASQFVGNQNYVLNLFSPRFFSLSLSL